MYHTWPNTREMCKVIEVEITNLALSGDGGGREDTQHDTTSGNHNVLLALIKRYPKTRVHKIYRRRQGVSER